MASTTGESPGAAIADSSTTSRTVSRSCTIDHDSAMRPCGVVSSVSPATLASTTLDEMAATAPRNRPSIIVEPSISATAVPMPMVTATCSGAPIRTSRPTSRNS